MTGFIFCPILELVKQLHRLQDSYNMAKKVLITGGSGLIGRPLTALLLKAGYNVSHLSRSKETIKTGEVPVYFWDIRNHFIEDGALDQVDVIVHLAGADIGEKRWTTQRKEVLHNSRVETAGLLYNYLKLHPHQVIRFISASGIAIYGHDTGGIELNEDRKQLGDDFLATLAKSWEAAADQFQSLGIKTVKLRTGIVLSSEGGALKKLLPPVKLGLGAALGHGGQYISWIHIKDHIRIIKHAIENEQVVGAYNAVAPNPVTNRQFMQTMAKVANRPFFLPAVPGFGLRAILGEMASMVIGGNNVSSGKVEASGFVFEYPTLEGALRSVLSGETKNSVKHL